ncbi:GAF domain-containing protein [Pontibacter fetidus]|uniref:GAF domain-containing protein n=1 Tax=Pontibacter fetidus TaxID=2700082 RepID=A0A6B2HBK2_9BACT|nr:GAF domain-containing protein [Pontibacter fetidus]NDK57292.1 GAF domain-containing protein [Pontibacter fetidus]
MAESLIVDQNLSKEEKYKALLPQIEALTTGETDLIANISNMVAALKQGLDFFWVGVYFNKEGQLVLGPFQGPIACTRIPYHKGVCGACYTQQQTIVVPDVEAFPGHIACSSDSKSEIVLPVIKDGEVKLVLDVDSDKLNNFDEVDQKYLEQLMKLVESWY